MSAPDVDAGGAAAWFERAPVPGLVDTAASVPGVIARDEELAAIALRAEQIGIPAWRVMVALGIPPPRPPATGRTGHRSSVQFPPSLNFVACGTTSQAVASPLDPMARSPDG